MEESGPPTDLGEAAGSQRKLIAFSLFGNDRMYQLGAEKNIWGYKDHLPDYTPIIYLARRLVHLGPSLAHLGALIRVTDGFEDWGAALWRFKALSEPHSRVIFRDLDSRPSERETAAVRAWEASNRAFHVMRDHPAHHTAVLAGMWGATAAGSSRLVPHIPGPQRSSAYSDHLDQGWLARMWPVIGADCLVHASYWKTYFGPTSPFPTSRPPLSDHVAFVGEGFDGNDRPRHPIHHDVESLCKTCACTIRCHQQ